MVQALRATGYRVRALSLNPPQGGLWPDDIEVHTADITIPLVVKSALQGVEAVAHLAALLHIVKPPPDGT